MNCNGKLSNRNRSVDYDWKCFEVQHQTLILTICELLADRREIKICLLLIANKENSIIKQKQCYSTGKFQNNRFLKLYVDKGTAFPTYLFKGPTCIYNIMIKFFQQIANENNVIYIFKIHEFPIYIIWNCKISQKVVTFKTIIQHELYKLMKNEFEMSCTIFTRKNIV